MSKVSPIESCRFLVKYYGLNSLGSIEFIKREHRYTEMRLGSGDAYWTLSVHRSLGDVCICIPRTGFTGVTNIIQSLGFINAFRKFTESQ